MSDASWFAFTTAPAAGFKETRRRFPEFAALEQMRERGIDAYAPTLRVARRPHRHAKRREIFLTPLLPGYCVARMAAPPTREALRSLYYLRGVVRRGLEPARLPAADVEALLALDGTATPLAGPLPFDASGKLLIGSDGLARRVLKPGDRATILSSGIEGTVQAVQRERALVLVELLGGLRQATVAVSGLELARA